MATKHVLILYFGGGYYPGAYVRVAHDGAVAASAFKVDDYGDTYIELGDNKVSHYEDDCITIVADTRDEAVAQMLATIAEDANADWEEQVEMARKLLTQ